VRIGRVVVEGPHDLIAVGTSGLHSVGLRLNTIIGNQVEKNDSAGKGQRRGCRDPAAGLRRRGHIRRVAGDGDHPEVCDPVGMVVDGV
jgi:hypothetical protein